MQNKHFQNGSVVANRGISFFKKELCQQKKVDINRDYFYRQAGDSIEGGFIIGSVKGLPEVCVE